VRSAHHFLEFPYQSESGPSLARKQRERECAESKWRPELAQLRGLSIRTILRSFDSGDLSDELKAAMMLLYYADYNTTGIPMTTSIR
jgi:hypothetical protein